MSRLTQLIIILFIVMLPLAAYATDPPHNMSYGISCLSNPQNNITGCHVAHNAGTAGFLLTNTAATIDNLCQSCHNGTIAEFVKGHSSTTTTTKYGTWNKACTDCHSPHQQYQWRSYGTQAYIFTGTVSSLSSTQLTDTSVNWAINQWLGSILVPNTTTITNSIYPDTNNPPTFMITGNNANTLTVKIVSGSAGLNASTSVGANYSIFYGRLIRSRMYTAGWNNINFYNNAGIHSFADGTTFTTSGGINYYTSNICETCHTQTNHHRYTSGTTFTLACSGQSHHNGQNCMACHPHSNGFEFTESHGSQDCIQCHSSVFNPMNTTTDFHHYMNNTQPVYPVLSLPATLGGTTDINRRCLMCHADHDVFSPEVNTSTGGRAYNLRAAISLSPTPTSTNTFTNTDFINSTSTPGICLSCHMTLQTKSYLQPDNTTTTPYVPLSDTLTNQVSAYNASAHNYRVSSLFTSSTETGCNYNNTFNANCTKCHNDTMYPKSSQGAQITTYPQVFGIHDSSISSIVAPLGLWLFPYLQSGLPSSPLNEKFCFQCHGASNPNAPNKDYYNVATMSGVSTSIDSAFNKPYQHPITTTSYLHKPYGEGLLFNDGTLSGANRHVACTDCHNPHTAMPSIPLYGASGVTVTNPQQDFVDLVSSNYTYIPNASVTLAQSGGTTNTNLDYKLCFKCHSNWAYGLVTNAPNPTPSASWQQTNMAQEFNVNNWSYHYVEGDQTASVLPASGTGCNSYGPNIGNVTPRASTTYGNFNTTYIGVMDSTLAGLTNTQIRTAKLRCSSCHGIDNASSSVPEGPHGSTNPFILKIPAGSPYNAWNNTVNYTNDSGRIWCFNCHDPNFTNSGFNSFGQNLHTNRHNGRPCQACHVAIPHGWKRYRLLRFDDCDPAPYMSIPNYGFHSGVTWATSGNWREGNCHSTGAVDSCG